MSERDKTELSLPLKQYLDPEHRADLEDAVWAKVSVRRSQALLARGAARFDARRPLGTQATLPVPLSVVLDESDEMVAERARLWRGVRARLHRPRSRRLPRKVALLLAAALGAAATFGLFVLTWRPSQPLAGQEPTGAGEVTRRAGALLAADGRPPGILDAASGPETLRLSDASEIRLTRGARVEPVLSTSSRFELLLARGTADFSVTPGGPRRWGIDAGSVRVEVVGTVFRVARNADQVEVSVSHGVVLVIGEDVPGRVRKLAAGQTLSVASRTPLALPTEKLATRGDSAPSAPAASAAGEVTVESRAAGAGTAARTPGRAPSLGHRPEAPSIEGEGSLNGVLVRSAVDASRRSADARRRSATTPEGGTESPHTRYAELGPTGLARATMQATTIEELLELADVARLSGHPQDAVAPLTRALDKFRGSSQSALAAFTLGRVLLDQLGVAAPAAEAFERAIVLGLPKALRADCYRRLAEAYGRAGNEAARARAEARFQTEFALPSSTLDKVAP